MKQEDEPMEWTEQVNYLSCDVISAAIVPEKVSFGNVVSVNLRQISSHFFGCVQPSTFYHVPFCNIL